MKVLGIVMIFLVVAGCQMGQESESCNGNYGFNNKNGYRYHSCEKNSNGSFKTLKDRAVYHHRISRDARTGRRTYKDQQVY